MEKGGRPMLHQGNFSEKELMNDLLMSEKQVSSAYTVGITESSCPNQADIFKAMAQRGWYNFKKAPLRDVQAAKDKFNQIKSELR
jgi:spore coat protein CotF